MIKFFLKYFIIYVHIFLFLLSSSSSLVASYKYYTVTELINMQNPKKIPHIDKLRRGYKQNKLEYSIYKAMDKGSENEENAAIAMFSSKIAYKEELDKYYALKEYLLNLMSSSSSMKILANVIRSGVSNINRDYLYCKLDRCYSEKRVSRKYNNKHMGIEYTQIDNVVLYRKNLWGNTFYSHMDIKGDNNETVNDKKKGVIIGYDNSCYTKLYIKADEQNIIDEKDDSAKIKSMSLGIYGNIPVKANIKGLVEIGFGKYETKRNLSLYPIKNILDENSSNIAKANFTCTTINADIEISKNVPLKSFILKPYVGLSISSNFYPSFKETSTTSLLTINAYSGTYWRSLARIGVCVQKDYKKLSISSKIFSEVILTSLSPEITYTYDYSTILKSKSTFEELFKPGVSLYLDYKVCERFSVSENIEVCKGGGFYVNVGIVYSFGKIVNAKEKSSFSKKIFVVTKENLK